MTWTPVSSINLTSDWQYTSPIRSGEYFRLKHTNFPRNGLYQVAQAEWNGDNTVNLYNGYTLEAAAEYDIVQLLQPGCFAGPQRIAIRKLDVLPGLETQMRRFLIGGVFQRQSFSDSSGQRSQWSVAIEVSSFIDNDLGQAIAIVDQDVQSSIAGATTIKTELDAAKLELDQINQRGSTSSPTSNGKQLTYASDGDANGLLYWLGTKNGAQIWTNPIDSGVVVARANTLTSPTGLNGLVDRQPSDIYSDNVQGNYYSLDLGTSNQFTPNYISIRNRSAVASRQLVNWQLQGLYSSGMWDVLLDVTNNVSFNAVNQWLSLPITGITKNYQVLRFFQTGPNSNGDYFMCLGEIELYGKLTTKG